MKVRLRWLGALMVLGALAIGLFPEMGAVATNIGNQGCTPGYWKNHPGNWEEYKAGDTVGSVFNDASPYGANSLLEALGFNGGDGINGAKRILLRAAVAAVLNAAHEGVGYPWRRWADPGNIIPSVNQALGSDNRATMLELAETLDRLNNLGCPLGR